MAISRQVGAVALRLITIVLFLKIIFAIKPTKKHLVELNNSMIQLQAASEYTLKHMSSLPNRAKYGPLKNSQCGLPIGLLYQNKDKNAKTLTQRLKKMKRILDTLANASSARDFSLQTTNDKFKYGLADLAFYLGMASEDLRKMGVRPHPWVKYNSKTLTEGSRKYIKCLGLKATAAAVQLVRYITFVKSVERAVADMKDDVHFIQAKISKSV